MPQPGDIGLTKIGGVLGWFVYLGQCLIGDRSKWTHAFVVLHNDMLIEAQPGGALLFPLDKYKNREVVYVSPDDLTQEQRDAIVAEATMLQGTPYSYADYVALFLELLGIRSKFLRKYVRTSGRLICSQLCDLSYQRGGYHLFDDGRLPMDITPGDLARRFNVR
jgi:uncharacterized protein YycO